MNAFMWRLLRVAILMATFSISLSWVIWLYGWPTWLVVALVPTALIDLWLENIKKAGSDK